MKQVLLVLGLLVAFTLTGRAQVACPAGALHCSQETWAASTSGQPTSYNIYRTLTSGGCSSSVMATTCTKAGTVLAPTLQFVDSPLAASTQYCYVITAVNAAGESLPSVQVCATTGADPVPSQVTGLTVVAK